MSTIYFYSHNKEYRCFSNFYPASFPVQGVTFKSSEQYFMYQKALIMGDRATANLILSANTPAEAKKLGRSIKPWNQNLWDQHKYLVMVDALTYKFSANQDQLKILLDTKDAVLAEASPFDKIWGIGLSMDDAERGLPWRGENLLGKALMQARDVLA